MPRDVPSEVATAAANRIADLLRERGWSLPHEHERVDALGDVHGIIQEEVLRSMRAISEASDHELDEEQVEVLQFLIDGNTPENEDLDPEIAILALADLAANERMGVVACTIVPTQDKNDGDYAIAFDLSPRPELLEEFRNRLAKLTAENQKLQADYDAKGIG